MSHLAFASNEARWADPRFCRHIYNDNDNLIIIRYVGGVPGLSVCMSLRPPVWGSLAHTTDGAGRFVRAKCVMGHNQTEKYDIEDERNEHPIRRSCVCTRPRRITKKNKLRRGLRRMGLVFISIFLV